MWIRHGSRPDVTTGREQPCWKHPCSRWHLRTHQPMHHGAHWPGSRAPWPRDRPEPAQQPRQGLSKAAAGRLPGFPGAGDGWCAAPLRWQKGRPAPADRHAPGDDLWGLGGGSACGARTAWSGKRMPPTVSPWRHPGRSPAQMPAGGAWHWGRQTGHWRLQGATECRAPTGGYGCGRIQQLLVPCVEWTHPQRPQHGLQGSRHVVRRCSPPGDCARSAAPPAPWVQHGAAPRPGPAVAAVHWRPGWPPLWAPERIPRRSEALRCGVRLPV